MDWTKIKPRPKVILLVEPMLLFCTGWDVLHLFKFYNGINFACCCGCILSWDRCILSLKKFHTTFKITHFNLKCPHTKLNPPGLWIKSTHVRVFTFPSHPFLSFVLWFHPCLGHFHFGMEPNRHFSLWIIIKAMLADSITQSAEGIRFHLHKTQDDLLAMVFHWK